MINTETAREVNIPLTPNEFNRLKRAADLAGITVQQLLEIAAGRAVDAAIADAPQEVAVA